MRFENWVSRRLGGELSEARHHKKHKKHKHKYHCPGCGGLVYVGRSHPRFGPVVLGYHDDEPHGCPTTSGGQPAHDPSTGAVAATSGAAMGAAAASGAGAPAGGGAAGP